MIHEADKGRATTLVLSIVCAFLFGFICGYLLNTYLAREKAPRIEYIDTHGYGLRGSGAVRRDILFYDPGSENVWSDYYEVIPEGNGRIKGTIFVDDNPAAGLELALIIANGRKTQTVTVKGDGSFHISIPKDEYYLNGLLIHNKEREIQNKIFVNEVAKYEGGFFACPFVENENLMKTFNELSEKYGPEEASRRMADKIDEVVSFKDQFGFKVDKEYVLPDFHYRTSIKIISPAPYSSAYLQELKFIWEAVSNACSYKIAINNIKKEGSTTSYYPALACDGIKSNIIEYEEVLQCMKKDEYYTEMLKPMQAGELYGLRVIAFDSAGEVITASGEDITDFYIFRVE